MSVAPLPLLIIAAGRPVESLRRQGDFAHWIRVAAGLQAGEVAVVDVESGESLPPHDRFSGVIISGSAAMVTERLEWSERCAGWLRAAAEADVPMLGICYGHQLLAHALGGEVGDNPEGRRMGTFEVELLEAAAEDPLFSGLPSRFPAHMTHVQVARRLPEGAVLLAQTGHDPLHAFRWGKAVWGVQFHPEFSVTHMRGYIRARAHVLRSGGADPEALLKAVRAAPVARGVLRRFAQLARTTLAPSHTD
ncbi:glutamine amidotransferase [Luteimonas sp. A478]